MTDSLIKDQIKLLSTTEQARFLTEDRISAWMDAVLRIDAGRLEWHVKRLFGFGGSEVGVLVAERNGLVDPFESARSICASKLMVARPEEPIPAMERGQYMEPVIQQLFMDKHRQFGAERDNKAMDAMSSAIGYRSWQNGSPDDVVLLGTGRRKKRFLIDYKAPGEDGYEVEGVPMRYAAQLHHYRMIAEKLGIKIDGMILVAVDYQKWHLETLNVPFDQHLENEILDAGDYYWKEYVLQGRLPDFGRKQQFDKSVLDNREHIERQALDFLTYKRIGDASYAKSKKLQEGLKSAFEKYKVADSRIQFAGGLLNVSAKVGFDVDRALEALGPVADQARLPEWDAEGLVEAAKAAGIDVAPFERAGKEYDEESLRNLLVAAKLNVEAYESESLTFALPKVKKGPVAERLAEVSEKASDLVEKMVPKLRTAIQQSGVDVSAVEAADKVIAKAKKTPAPSM